MGVESLTLQARSAFSRWFWNQDQVSYLATGEVVVGDERKACENGAKVYLVGGGIASLAAAAFLIRDADVPGRNITILEQSGRLGGSLDGGGSPQEGYIIRGERILENKYVCTYDLFSSIPGLSGKTVTQEIFGWNQVMKNSL